MQKLLNVNKLREDFPILFRKVNGKRLVYLDNAATTQKPRQVISALKEFYEQHNSNVHRGVYQLSEEATLAYEASRGKIASFVGARPNELIFTKNATEAINLVAYSLTWNLESGDEILISQMEHHSNFVPWQQLAKIHGLNLKFVKITQDGKLDLENLERQINKRTKIVSLTHVSNALGTVNPIHEISKISHDNGSLLVVDAAQSVGHMPVNVKKLGADFLAFSGHKMLGPTGIGCLYGKQELLENMKPFLYGGDMIKEVKFDSTEFNEVPWKFEAGTQPIAEAIALGVAVDYLKAVGMENILDYEKQITEYALEKIKEIEGLKIHGPFEAPIISFNIGKVHSHDVSAILDSEGVAIRGGHHCCMPLMQVLGISGTARASFYLYNSREDVDSLIEGLEKVRKVFS